MSLADFQNAWTEILLEHDKRTAWHNGTYENTNLNNQEKKAIKDLTTEFVETNARSTARGREQVLLFSVPKSIRNLAGEKLLENYIHDYSNSFPAAGIYPRYLAIPALLFYIKERLTGDSTSIPHLIDLISYEIALLSARVFILPSKKQKNNYPTLAENVKVFLAGENFQEFLIKFTQHEKTDDIPEQPKFGYLLINSYYGIKIEKMHWTVFTLLSRCQGKVSWQQMVENLIAEEPELKDQRNNLLAWEKYYLQEKVLTFYY